MAPQEWRAYVKFRAFDVPAGVFGIVIAAAVIMGRFEKRIKARAGVATHLHT